MKRVLFLIGNLNSGGAERSLVNLLQLINYDMYSVDLIAFKERGPLLNEIPDKVNIIHDVDVLHYLYNDSIKDALKTYNIKLLYAHLFGTVISKIITPSGMQKEQYRWKKYYSKLIPQLEIPYDIAISYMEGSTTYYLIDKVVSKRKICWVHTDYNKVHTNLKFDNRYFDNADSVVTISDSNVRILENLFPNIKKKLCVLPNLSNSNTIKLKSKEFIPNEYDFSVVNIISIGRLVPSKAMERVVYASDVLRKIGIKFKWWIVGDGELREELERLISEKELNNYVQLLGLKSNPYPYIANADVIVQTSQFEGKSIVLDEAKILGVPIVSTNYDTVYDQVNTKEGVIVEMNANAIAEGIITVLENRERYQDYLKSREYGNQSAIKDYYRVFEGMGNE